MWNAAYRRGDANKVQVCRDIEGDGHINIDV